MDLFNTINQGLNKAVGKAKTHVKKISAYTEVNYVTLMTLENEEAEGTVGVTLWLNDLETYFKKGVEPSYLKVMIAAVQEVLKRANVNVELSTWLIANIASMYLNIVMMSAISKRVQAVYGLDKYKVFYLTTTTFYITTLIGFALKALSGKFTNKPKENELVKLFQLISQSAKPGNEEEGPGVIPVSDILHSIWSVMKGKLSSRLLNLTLTLATYILLLSKITKMSVKMTAVRFWKDVLVPEKGQLIKFGLKIVLDMISTVAVERILDKVGEDAFLIKAYR